MSENIGPSQPISRERLVDFLDGLDSEALTRICTRVTDYHGDNQNLDRATRVQNLFAFVESSIGPGVNALASIVGMLYPGKIPDFRLSPNVDGNTFGHSTLPPVNQHFTGREKELTQLRDALTTGKTAAVTQAIAGLGGVGKTSLAVAYANRHRDEYDTILFASAESLTTLTGSYRRIAAQLALPQANADNEETVREAVLRYLQTAQPSASGKTPFLLILDNADFYQPGKEETLPNTPTLTPEILRLFLPKPPHLGHVLLTTRSQRLHGSLGIGVDHILELGIMEPDEAIHFLTERVKGEGATLDSDEAAAVRDLAQELGYLPLAMEQVAAYIAAMGETFEEYLALFREDSVEYLEQWTPEAGNYGKTLGNTWIISFKEVERINPASADLVRLCAFVAPDAIPMELAVAAATVGIDSLTAHFGNGTDPKRQKSAFLRLLEPLTRYSLATVNPETATFSLHRLVQAVTRWRMSADTRTLWTTNALEALNQAFPSGDFKTWFVYERFVGHVQALAQYLKRGDFSLDMVGLLLNNSAYYLYHRARFSEAETLYDEALSIHRVGLPEGHPLIATSLNNLATLYLSQGRYSQAEPLLKEALSISRAGLPEGHPSIATSLNNLALLYKSQKRYSDAEPLYAEALSIRRVGLPKGHPDIATSLNNLAELYKSQERYSDAEPLLVEALSIHRAGLPEGHPLIAQSLNNLAGLYRNQGRYSEAELLYAEALTILVASWGEEHPNTKVVQKNVLLFQREKRLREKG